MDAEQKQRADQVRLLLREVNHRSKNMLTVVQAIARHSIRSNPAGFITDFEKRLQALARSQDLIVLSEWKGVQMEDIVRAQLAHVGRDARQRIVVDGEPVMITPAAAQTFSMAVHELVTNAGKYGALYTSEGSVSVSWGFVHDETDRQFRFAWAEQGGPPVEQPHGRGFGTTVLETIAARALSASVVMDYRSEGFAWRLRCPAQNVTSQQE
jgi:two-component sensor histidine kinase